MPAGSPWCTARPTFEALPQTPLWHVYKRGYEWNADNRNSRARMALVGTHGMFYASDTAAGALWETVLRSVAIDSDRTAHVLPKHLRGFNIVKIRALKPDLPLLSLGQSGLRALFADPDSHQAQAVATLLHQPHHALTHPEAARLFAELQGVGVPEMPVLSWPSRMHHASTAFLAYSPPMNGSWWEKVGDEIELDDRVTGHPVVAEALATAGYTWSTPLATQATVSPPDAGPPE